MTKTLCSIYYMPLKCDRSLYNGHFAIPAVGKNEKPYMLEIRDHIQIDDEPWFKGTFNGRQLKKKTIITGEDIAADVLAEWTARHPEMNPSAHPGVFLVRDVVYLYNDDGTPQLDIDNRQAVRPATAEEKAAMFAEDLESARQIQAAWDEACIMKGDAMADDVKKIPFIPAYCKEAAKYRGRDRKWLYALKDGDVRRCPFCTTNIATEAIKCPNCSEIVDRQRYDEMTGKKPVAPPLHPNEPKKQVAA